MKQLIQKNLMFIFEGFYIKHLLVITSLMFLTLFSFATENLVETITDDAFKVKCYSEEGKEFDEYKMTIDWKIYIAKSLVVKGRLISYEWCEDGSKAEYIGRIYGEFTDYTYECPEGVKIMPKATDEELEVICSSRSSIEKMKPQLTNVWFKY